VYGEPPESTKTGAADTSATHSEEERQAGGRPISPKDLTL
jgi:hypothetical protein